MPADVAARVDAAVRQAAEAASTTVVPMARRRRLRGSPAIAGGAAAAAVVVLVAALVAGNVIRPGHSTTNGASRPGGERAGSSLSNAAQTKTWATGRDYTAATLAILVPGLVAGTPPTAATGVAPLASPAATPSPVATSGTPSYSQDDLRASPQALQACGRILADGVSTTPVAVDFARFDGKRAVIVVLPAIGHPTQLDVWVVRTACSSASLDLYFQRVPRP
jgi:hypothetical protein